jgi:hypothetical protein
MMRTICAFAALAGFTAVFTVPAGATNLVQNGDFATGDFSDWTLAGFTNDGLPEVVIPYNSHAAYPNGAQGDPIPPFPGATSNYAVYFVSDSADEILQQSIFLTPGQYDVGFWDFGPSNGCAQPEQATLSASIGTLGLASGNVPCSPAQTWNLISQEFTVTSAGSYDFDFTFVTTQYPAKDVVIGDVFVTPAAVPEPSPLALFGIALLALGGLSLRRESA